MPMAIKIVRGAYLFEERALAEKFGYESPCCTSFESTTNNYESNVKFVLDNFDAS